MFVTIFVPHFCIYHCDTFPIKPFKNAWHTKDHPSPHQAGKVAIGTRPKEKSCGTTDEKLARG